MKDTRTSVFNVTENGHFESTRISALTPDTSFNVKILGTKIQKGVVNDTFLYSTEVRTKAFGVFLKLWIFMLNKMLILLKAWRLVSALRFEFLSLQDTIDVSWNSKREIPIEEAKDVFVVFIVSLHNASRVFWQPVQARRAFLDKLQPNCTYNVEARSGQYLLSEDLQRLTLHGVYRIRTGEWENTAHNCFVGAV